MRENWFIHSLIFFLSIQLYGQKGAFVDWENPSNFDKYGIKKVFVYSVEVKKNGKTKKDSLLLRSFEYDKNKATIKGVNHNLVIVNHGGGSFLNFYNFQNQYIKDTLLLSKTEIPFAKKKKQKKTKFKILFL